MGPITVTPWGHGAPELGAVRLTSTHLPFCDAGVDRLWCSGLALHAPDLRRLLAEVERVLVVGGRARVRLSEQPGFGDCHRSGPSSALQRLRTRSVGGVLDEVDRDLGLRLIDATHGRRVTQRWMLKVPGLRELTVANSVLDLERVARPRR